MPFLSLAPYRNMLPSPSGLKCHPSSARSSSLQELWARKTLVQASYFTGEEMASRGSSLARVHTSGILVSSLSCGCCALCRELHLHIYHSFHNKLHLHMYFICSCLDNMTRSSPKEATWHTLAFAFWDLTQFSAQNIGRWYATKRPSFFYSDFRGNEFLGYHLPHPMWNYSCLSRL